MHAESVSSWVIFTLYLLHMGIYLTPNMTKCGKTDKKTDHFYLNVFFAFGKYSDALKIQFGFLSYHE